jgi:uncharacterized protein (TIGR00266 family)
MTDDIDYTILGDDMQIVEIGLDPGETVIAEAGAMNYMDEGITFESVMGDGTKPPGGFWDQAFGAGKRVLAGESLFLTHFHNAGSTKRTLAFAAPYPGKIIPLDLAALGGDFTCQKDSFLCAARGTQLDITFTKNIGVGLFGGEGFILERLRGSSRVFVHAGGTVVKKDLAGGRLLVDTGCLVGFTTGISYDITQAGNLKSMIFGGEGLFLADLSGTGTVYLQSLPFSRLARRIVQSLRRRGEFGKGEGSILGGLGNILMGGQQ